MVQDWKSLKSGDGLCTTAAAEEARPKLFLDGLNCEQRLDDPFSCNSKSSASIMQVADDVHCFYVDWYCMFQNSTKDSFSGDVENILI